MATPVDSIKDVVQSFVTVPEFDKTPKESRRAYRPKRCGNNNNNNKDEDNSPKTINDKKDLQASSQKFRQQMIAI